MEREAIEILKVFVTRDIPDDPKTRRMMVDDLATAPINAFDLCMIVTTIIDIFISKSPEQFQNEEEDYVMKTLPMLLKNRHGITEKIS